MQLHLKKLRKDIDKNYKSIDSKKIKYYVAGEYGTETHRPHYHVILFGIGKKDRKIIDRNWSHGAVLWDIKNRPLDKKAFSYACGYVQKKIYDENGDNYYARVGIVEPFNRMSKGLGKEHALKFRGYYESNDYKYTKEENSSTVPRYYIKLWKQQDKELMDRVQKVMMTTYSPYANKNAVQELEQIYQTTTMYKLEQVKLKNKAKKLEKYKKSVYHKHLLSDRCVQRFLCDYLLQCHLPNQLCTNRFLK